MKINGLQWLLKSYLGHNCIIFLLRTFLFALIVTACVTKDPSSKEPLFEGKQLSCWLQDFGYESDFRTQFEIERNEKAENAIRGIGRDALPYLLKAIQSDEFERRFQGMYGLCAAGSNAAPIIPQLAILLKNERVETARFAAVALASIGSEAIPALLKGFTNGIFEVRSIALDGLAKNGEKSVAAVPALVAALNDSITNLNERIIIVLGEIGKESDLVVPLLIQFLGDPYYGYRLCAAEALQKFPDKAKPAIPILKKMLKDDHPWVREAAEETLQIVAP